MIKNIIFDVGNVLFEYRWIEALMDTGLSREEANETGKKVFDEKLWVDFDAGNINVPDLIEEFGKLYPDVKNNIAEFILHPERMPISRPEVCLTMLMWQQTHWERFSNIMALRLKTQRFLLTILRKT